MIKKTFLWILYFAVCAVVIAAAVRAGSKLDHCHECPSNFYVNNGK